MKSQRTQTAKTILRKNNNARGLVFSDFKTYHKAKVIKTVKCWHKDRHTDPPNKRRHTVKIFDKVAKTTR